MQQRRELIVIAKPEVGFRANKGDVMSLTGEDLSRLGHVLDSKGIMLEPLFGMSEDKLRVEAIQSEVNVPDLSIYYRVIPRQIHFDENLSALAGLLREAPGIMTAYVKPPAELPLLNTMLPDKKETSRSADFRQQQGYLNPAPDGIDARHAWTLIGGGGEGVEIIDIEGSWQFTHESLRRDHGGIISNGLHPSIDWRNHGTAVIGVIGGNRNNFGITGICPDARIRGMSIFDSQQESNSAGAIFHAARILERGDILLLELHRPGPRHDYSEREDQEGYIPIEWWPDDFAAIRYATSRGVIVVEAAGNGGENLDDGLYDKKPIDFQPEWVNPFRRQEWDSGAIVVGAGAPPKDTHGRNHGLDRSRLDFSNFGNMVDCQGWGKEVTTCGYGDLQGGSDEDMWYTNIFSGTSSASPIVVGAIGCIQGILRAAKINPLDPATARNLLRTTGSPQQASASTLITERIGNRPDLKQLLQQILEDPLGTSFKD